MADDSLQLSVYAIAMGSDKPVKTLIFQNLANNSTIETVRSPEDLHETELKIIKVPAGIEGGLFEAKIGRHCNWCAFRAICPEMEVSVPAPACENTVEQLSWGFLR